MMNSVGSLFIVLCYGKPIIDVNWILLSFWAIFCWALTICGLSTTYGCCSSTPNITGNVLFSKTLDRKSLIKFKRLDSYALAFVVLFASDFPWIHIKPLTFTVWPWLFKSNIAVFSAVYYTDIGWPFVSRLAGKKSFELDSFLNFKFL